MKLLNKSLLFALILLFINAVPDGKSNCSLSKDYTITINGTSNLHSWEEKVEMVTVDCAINLNKDGSVDIQTVHIKMNVHSIKSDMGVVMNNNTYKALKGDINPEIIFELMVPVKSVLNKPIEQITSVKGNLSIAGITHYVDIAVKVLRQNQDKIVFKGSHVIKMNDYGIDPPTALFGTLKTGNEVTVNFNVKFKLT